MHREIRELPIRINKTSETECNLCKLEGKTRVSRFVLGVNRNGNPLEYVDINGVWRILLP
jgi:hypothetical protein